MQYTTNIYFFKDSLKYHFIHGFLQLEMKLETIQSSNFNIKNFNLKISYLETEIHHSTKDQKGDFPGSHLKG